MFPWSRMRIASASFCFAAMLLAPCRPAAGQCSQQWLPGDPISFTHGNCHATVTWDPDGAGPAPAVLVVGGRFAVGSMVDTSLASFDGTAWSALGAPPFVEVRALAVWNGQLVAAGSSGLQYTIATWDGSAWAVAGITAGINSAVHAMAVFQGELYVGGRFSSVNGVAANRIAKWNGTSWSQLAQGVTGDVLALAVFGALWVGGSFNQAGVLAAGNIATWNGTAWSIPVAFDAPVRCLAARNGSTASSSFLFAGGDFTTVGSVPAIHVARFSSSSGAWTALPGLPGTACQMLHVRNTGTTTFQLHAGVAGGFGLDSVWRLNGTVWSSLGPTSVDAVARPTAMAFFNGQYVVAVANPLVAAVGLPETTLAHDGTAWQPLRGPGFDATIRAVATAGNDLVVGGNFVRYGGQALAHIARGLPGAWQPLGGGVDGVVFAVCTLPNGDLVAAGDFAMAGGAAANRIARWNGTTWSPLGAGADAAVHALLALPDGQLIAGGDFTTTGGVVVNHIARWDGTTWSPLGSGMNTSVYALARLNNGDIVAAGSFSSAGGQPASRIARWNGTTWSPLGTGLQSAAMALAVLPDGHLIAGGSFQTAGGIFSPSVARWNGTAWFAQSSPGTGWDNSVQAVVALPNGDYFGAGMPSIIAVGTPEVSVARHTGTASSLQWAGFEVRDAVVLGAALLPNGDVAFGGDFLAAGGLASKNLAVLRPTCPASAVPHGSGCTGAGGPNVLTATALPWIGSTLRARASGMPPNAVALAVTGLAPLSVPLPVVLAQGVAGCTLLASPDLLQPSLPSAGLVDTQLLLPASPALAGQVLYHQVVPLAFDAAGNLAAVTGTNGLLFTVGVL